MAEIPKEAQIYQYVEEAYFSDCFSSSIDGESKTAMDVALDLNKATPKWVDYLMALRNKVVSRIGLKDLGVLSNISKEKAANDYQVGDQVGIFTLHHKAVNEVILEDDDKHLNVKVSLYLEPKDGVVKVSISTVVHVYNRLGRFYMFFVGPVHKIIVPAVIAKL